MTTENLPTPPASTNPPPNTPVQGEPTAVIPPSGATFDTIEEVMAARAEKGADEVKAEAEKQVKVQEKAQEIVGEKEDKKRVEAAAEAIKQTVARKVLGIDGDKPVELSAAAKFKHKVDGKEVEVALEDLLNDYSGQTSWRQRFTDLDKQKKAFEAQLRTVNSSLETLSKFVSEGKSYEALEHLCDMAGIDKVEFLKSYIGEAEAVSDQFSSMTEEQKEVYFSKKKNDYLANKLKEKEDREKATQTQQSLKAEVDSMISQAGITTQEFQDNLKFLVEQGVFQDDKNITPQQVAKAVVDYSGSVRRYDAAYKAILAVDPKQVENKKLLDSLALPTNTDLSHEELVRVVSRVLSDDTSTASASAETSQEAKKASPEKSGDKGKKATPEKADSKKDEPEKEKKRPVLWDDLE